MHILNIASYKFVALNDTDTLRASLKSLCGSLEIKGTILVGHEGINLNLAGTPEKIAAFKSALTKDERFADMRFRESYSDNQPFKRLKVKPRKEIITLRQPAANPLEKRAPDISPEELKRWLDEKRDITLLDTRNDYEVRFGTFTGAIDPNIKDFSHFPEAIKNLPRNKPVVMFCTGGIRCEKAALHMLNEGFPEVYQLDGGILNYFEKVGESHYEGECFVFDERVSLNPHLNCIGTKQCRHCQGPILPTQPNCASGACA